MRKHSTYTFGITTIAAIGLLVAGFFCPPMGAIDNSVLSACGILFAFAALAQLPAILGKTKHVEVQAGGVTLTAHGDTPPHAERLDEGE